LYETRVANVAWFWKGSRRPAHASSAGRRGCGHGEGYSRVLAAYDDRPVGALRMEYRGLLKEFVVQASRCRHPFDDVPEVPPALAKTASKTAESSIEDVTRWRRA
jgi:hypothetical protein